MKDTIRKNIVDLPYSLHDSRVNKMRIENKRIVMHFSEGFFKPMNNDCLSVKENAVISINGLDLDFCYVYLINTVGGCGKFTGEKFSLVEFITRQASMKRR